MQFELFETFKTLRIPKKAKKPEVPGFIVFVFKINFPFKFTFSDLIFFCISNCLIIIRGGLKKVDA